jgi:hypothetical protein
MRSFGQPLDGQIAAEIFAGIGQRALHAIRTRIHIEQGGELRLPAAAPLIQHELARNSSRRLRPEIAFDDRKREIDTCAHARRGPDLPIDDIDAVFIQRDIRILLPEIARVIPVRGRAFAIEQTRGGEHERACTDGCDTPRS